MLSINELSIERLRQIVTQQIEAGLLDPVTFAARASIDEKVEVLGTKASGWKRCRIRNHVFDMPDSMVNPRFLSAGGYGCVAECWYKGQKVAVKKVAVPGKSNADDTIRLLREVMILKKAQEERQESVCQVLDIYANASCGGPKQLKQIYIVMPLYYPGCLEDVTISSPEMFKSIASQTLQALNWLHSQGILHRDIKRENVFYNTATNRAVLGDMGNARLRSIAKMTGKNEVGTKCYQAPEFMIHKPYSFSSDIWSLAVCWYEMLCLDNGQDTMFPFFGAVDIERLNKQRALCQLVNPTHKYRIHSTPENKNWASVTWSRVADMEHKWNETAYSRILRSMFAFDKKRRPTTLDLFEDPFFAGSKPHVRVEPIFEELDVTDYEVARSRLYDLPTIRPSATVCSSTKCPSDTAPAAKDSSKCGTHNTSSTACLSETGSASKSSNKDGAHDIPSEQCTPETGSSAQDTSNDEVHGISFEQCTPKAGSSVPDASKNEVHDLSSKQCTPETGSSVQDTSNVEVHDIPSEQCMPETGSSVRDTSKNEVNVKVRSASPVSASVPVTSSHTSMHVMPETGINLSPATQSVESNTRRRSNSEECGDTSQQSRSVGSRLDSLLMDLRSPSRARIARSSPRDSHFYNFWAEDTLKAREFLFSANASNNDDMILSEKRERCDDETEPSARETKVRCLQAYRSEVTA